MSRFFLATGLKYALYAIGVYFIFAILDFDFLASVSLCLALLFLFFYRKTGRISLDISDKGIVSPVDGFISKIQKEDDKLCVVIDSGLLQSGICRMPLEATIKSNKISRGSRVGEKSKLFFNLNEKVETVFETKKYTVEVIQILRQSFFSLENNLLVEKIYKSGAVYGFAFNAKTYIYLPDSFRMRILEGAKVSSGETILGYFE